MALKMRLRKQGRTNRPFYRIVITDSRNKRDGAYVEAIGWYDPMSKNDDQTLLVKADRAQHWVEQGVEMTEKAEALIGRAAPSVTKWKAEQVAAKRAKARVKNRARRQKKAAAAS